MRVFMWLLLVGSAGAAVAVSWLADDVETVGVQRVDRAARAAAPADPLAGRALVPLAPSPLAVVADAVAAEARPTNATRAAWPALSPLARQAWSPPPAPPPPPPPPPPPVVVPPPAPPPAFPYQWLGQVEQEGRLLVFLAGPQRTLAVAVGEILDQRWRVDGADAGRLLLTWLPTHTAVTVAAR